jgi:peptide/nickel transport system ATP-binding protein
MGVILITHDLTMVRQFADHVHVMQHGEVREQGPTERSSPTPSTPTPARCSPPSPRGRPTRPGREPETVLKGENVRVQFTLRSGRLLQAAATTRSSRWTT